MDEAAARTSLSPEPRSISRARSTSRNPSFRRAETDDSLKAGRVWAREPEKDPWAPCILALDGGGIRGYSSLLILTALMQHIWEWELKLDEEDELDRAQLCGGRASLSPEPNGHLSPVGSTTRGRQERPDEAEAATTEIEESYGVNTQVHLDEEQEKMGEIHLEDDHLTAKVSARKALSADELLPCHYFDFMFGTSTGGLIATILGRLRMSVPEGLELYRTVGDTLFGKKRTNVPLMTKYYHEPLEKAVRDVVRSRCRLHAECDGNDLHPWAADGTQMDALEGSLPDVILPFDVDSPRVCQSCCLTATNDDHISEAHLLRTYHHYYSEKSPNWITPYNQGADMLPVWQVLRATTSAPFYFAMVTAVVNDVVTSFMDGGIRENNPSGAALSEFHALYADKLERPALLLSVGTGRPNAKNKNGFADSSMPSTFSRLPLVRKFLEKRAIFQNLLIKYTEGEHQHLTMRETAQGEHTWYKRLNVSEGFEEMALDDWVNGDWNGQTNVPGGDTLTRMERATAAYLERDFDPTVDSYAPPSVMLDQAAEKLVRQRRAREKADPERWAVFVGRNIERNKRMNESLG